MMRKSILPFSSLWAKWKALRFPWRSHILIGIDLKGNTYWEFPDVRGMPGSRMRRIVKYPKDTHLGNVNVAPMWHQWLRYQRPDPPTVQEQQHEEARKARMKILAAQADARWEAKPKIGQHIPDPSIINSGPDTTPVKVLPGRAPPSATTTPAPVDTGDGIDNDPWKNAKGGPSASWKPGAWTPGSKHK